MSKHLSCVEIELFIRMENEKRNYVLLLLAYESLMHRHI